MINFLIKPGLWELHVREFQGFLNKDGVIEISQIKFSGSSNNCSAKRMTSLSLSTAMT